MHQQETHTCKKNMNLPVSLIQQIQYNNIANKM